MRDAAAVRLKSHADTKTSNSRHGAQQQPPRSILQTQTTNHKPKAAGLRPCLQPGARRYI